MHFYDSIAPVYDTLFTDNDAATENEQVKELIKPLCKGRVLDVGCGTGLLLDLLWVDPAHYLGLDPSAGMLARFAKKHPFYSKCLRNVSLREYIRAIGLINPPRYDAVIGLFGVGSYLSPLDLTQLPLLMGPGGKYFLMFYKPDYFPETYRKTGTKTGNMYGTEMRPSLIKRLLKNGCRVTEFNNYLIATNA